MQCSRLTGVDAEKMGQITLLENQGSIVTGEQDSIITEIKHNETPKAARIEGNRIVCLTKADIGR